ncbi:MAG: sigma-70 family RNA polymerase sigma factor [Streptomyces sp.]|nr:sigma-70 family RNA polymerase sigma factor [Streptomyces sp.]
MTGPVPRHVEDLLRELAPQVLGALIHRYGRFDTCEDATQEALLKAARHWPGSGIPDNPRGWLLTTASRVLIDEFRSDTSRRRREDAHYAATPQSELLSRPADADRADDRDDSLELLFLCCHPSLPVPSQIALTLRAVGGLTTAQIAAAFLVPEATMAQRISRAKAALRSGGTRFGLRPGEAAGRLGPVRHVLYLVFNEGYTASSGESLTAPDLSAEAVRLARLLHRALPEDGETAGLLALMLLTDARRPARTLPDGALVPLAEQDRTRWVRSSIAEGVDLLSRALPRGRVGPYQLKAAIAAVYDEAPTMDDTDWPQILGLYDLLEQAEPNPMTTLNRAVAVAMVHGPRAGLEVVAALESEGRLARSHRLLATRAHLRELAGDHRAAAADYRQAARLTASLPERRYLTDRAASADQR